MTKKIEKIIKNYAHDYRDLGMNKIQLEGFLISFKNEVMEQIKTDLLEIADKGELEELRREIIAYFK